MNRHFHIWFIGLFPQLFAVVTVIMLFSFPLLAQVKGETPPVKGEIPSAPKQDTSMVFSSPRPLIASENSEGTLHNAWGVDVLFSGNGFGGGFFYHHEFSQTMYGFVHLGISGAQNTDELEQFNPETGRWEVPNKINRLFMFPLSFGVQYRLFQEELTETLKPFLQAGAGPAFIMSTPYNKEFFSAFGHAQVYVRPSAFVGMGVYFGDSKKNLTSAQIRYYVIPFGGNGLESIQDYPIKDFGGLFLSLSIGLLN